MTPTIRCTTCARECSDFDFDSGTVTCTACMWTELRAARSTIATLTARAEAAERERDEALRAVEETAAGITLAQQEIATLRAELERVTGEREEFRAEVGLHRADRAAAAGDLPVPVPEPGTDMARLLIANRLLHHRVREAEGERDEALRLAHIGEHRFPDLTWKARCEEAAADLRLARADSSRLRAAVEEARRAFDELGKVHVFDGTVPWDENETPAERARAASRLLTAALSPAPGEEVDEEIAAEEQRQAGGPLELPERLKEMDDPISPGDFIQTDEGGLILLNPTPAPGEEHETAKRERARANRPACPSLMHGDDPLCACRDLEERALARGRKHLEDARQTERERCARIVETTCSAADAGDGKCCAWASVQREIAAAIRITPTPPGEAPRPSFRHALGIAKEAREIERERAAHIAETHPLHPSTRTGERQRWLRAEIAKAIRGEVRPLPKVMVITTPCPPVSAGEPDHRPTPPNEFPDEMLSPAPGERMWDGFRYVEAPAPPEEARGAACLVPCECGCGCDEEINYEGRCSKCVDMCSTDDPTPEKASEP